MEDNFVLAIDFGTQSVRAIIYDKTGNEHGKAKIPFSPYFSLANGWAEQKPETYFDNFVAVIQKIKADFPDAFDKIAAIGVTTIRDTITFIDKNNKVLRPFLVWLDERECSVIEEAFPAYKKALFKLVGMYETVCNIRRITKMNWVKENEPEVWNNAYKLIQLSGYINLMLTGKVVDSVASQIGHIPFNYKAKKWQTKSDLSRELCDITDDMNIDLINPTEIIGGVTAEAAKITGLKEGLPVVACGSDKGCETFGSGVLGDGLASVSMGTTATIQLTTSKYVEPEPFMPAYPAVLDGKWNPEFEIMRGCWMVSWFKEQFGQPEVQKAKETGKSAEYYLDELLDKAPVGCEGLALQPYWSPTVKMPEGKGTIIGWSDVHTRAHLYRAIIEGIGFGLYEGLDNISSRAKQSVDTVMISGGGSSDKVCQILADILGIPVKKTQTYENCALGAAMLVYMGLGEFKSAEEAVKNMVRDGKCYQPDAKNHEQYMMLYHTVYERIYKTNRKTFFNIREYNRKYSVKR
ncbi:MAG: FGGY-family carbohydrate kinase [Clostridia bacterium]|nr:FGGY-family carbohydrate kinase [Clostridia bacterium]